MTKKLLNSKQKLFPGKKWEDFKLKMEMKSEKEQKNFRKIQVCKKGRMIKFDCYFAHITTINLLVISWWSTSITFLVIMKTSLKIMKVFTGKISYFFQLLPTASCKVQTYESKNSKTFCVSWKYCLKVYWALISHRW